MIVSNIYKSMRQTKRQRQWNGRTIYSKGPHYTKVVYAQSMATDEKKITKGKIK